ncbi:hypothetical protein [Hymenobacter metallicola]|uniref:Uncharacterized protein n=1 Tax=Hymenobacter metallicola TaxID=2563114 RepID=A0A4Z0Q243_9BACT|nr:hypothetical protein [Hymenobacter metallicola]TGE22792.1 hypothetical protein E5K02_20725 [Hymenobacter metallicola]
MIKHLLCLSLLSAPLTLVAQEYTKTERDLRFLNRKENIEKVGLFKSLSDTAGTPTIENTGKTPPFYYVVGTTSSPKWLAVEFKNKVYFTRKSNLEPSVQESINTVLADAKKKDAKLAALDDKNGFRTYHFGDDVSTIPGLKEVEKSGDTKYYTKTDENLKIGDADLHSITYGFYKGKLHYVVVRIKGIVDSRKVLAALETQYGSGYKSNRYLENYYWFGNKVNGTYDENSVTHDTTVSFSSVEIAKQKEEDAKAAAKKAGSDL